MPDMIGCPFHQSAICSLCCTLEKYCKGVCKTDSNLIQIEVKA